MTRSLTCLLCGHESPDVRVSLVEDPSPSREVQVKVRADARRDPRYVEVTVPERYYPLPRCRDEGACTLRQAEADASPTSTIDSASSGSWL